MLPHTRRPLCALAIVALSAAAPAPLVTPAAGGEAWNPASVAKLQADLDATLAGAPALRGAHVGVIVLETATGRVLYAHDADDAFQPASTLKLLVGSVALDRLGPTYRFRSEVAASGASLLLVGGGDPLLGSDDVTAAAAAVRSSGIASVSALTVDDGRFEAAPYPAGWTWDDFAYDYAAPVSALTIDENVVHVTFGSDGSRVFPTSDPSLVAASVLACRAERPGFAAEPASRSAGTSEASSTEPLDSLTVAPDCAALTGSLAAGAKAELDIAVRDAGDAALSRFALALRGAGVAVPAGVPLEVTHAGSPPSGTPIVWTHDSPPLASWLGPRFWIPSDNLFAELLLRELAYAGGVHPGTTAGGIALERAWLQSIGVDPATTTVADGCGMSQYDRITPRDLAAILQHDWNGPNRQLVLDSLPVGGARGSIEGIPGTPAAGRTFAKTGSMMHVRGLAGYLATQRHGAVTFAFNVDDWIGDYPALAAVRAQVLSRVIGD